MAIKFKPGDRVVYAQLDLFNPSSLYQCTGVVDKVNSAQKTCTVTFDNSVGTGDVNSSDLELLPEVNNGTQARLQEQT